ncbi:unnamed protein product, partial [Mesorhabditis belari]|uniref:Major facilitator superfamily (MFS) profile domain-containing protein n=1 Tax=Mesorhabditis belari TaxID=2138241 RepID=A0AAF3J1V4_9BILA
MMPFFSFFGTRHLVLLITTACLTSILSNMNTYNFTKICISNDTSSTHNQNYTKHQQSMLQSFVAWGTLVGGVPYVYLFSKYSHRYLFISAGIISAVSTALIPLANQGGFGYFLVARVIQGVAFAATSPLIGALTATWAPLGEHGIFLALATGFTQLANIFTMPVSGALCSSNWGWPAVYYVHAIVTAIVFTLFFFFYRNHPNIHPLVSPEELKRIEANKNNEKKASDVPYFSIFTSLTIWAVWIAALGDLLSVQLVSLFNPQYMKDYLKYDILNTGFMAALPVIVQFVVKCFSGAISDALYCLNETTKVRIFNTFALGVSGLAFILLALMNNAHPSLNIVVLVFTESMIGFNTAGFNKCATLHSRQYSHFVMTQIINIWAVCILVEPFIVNPILGDGSYVGWRNVFLLHAGILLATNVVFCFFADATPAKWTLQKEENDSENFDEKRPPIEK